MKPVRSIVGFVLLVSPSFVFQFVSKIFTHATLARPVTQTFLIMPSITESTDLNATLIVSNISTGSDFIICPSFSFQCVSVIPTLKTFTCPVAATFISLTLTEVRAQSP